MSTYLISYDLRSPGRNYEPLYEYLRSYGTRSKPLESVWIIVAEKSAKTIRDEITAIVDSGDGVLVLKSGFEAAWRGVGSGDDWLKKNL